MNNSAEKLFDAELKKYSVIKKEILSFIFADEKLTPIEQMFYVAWDIQDTHWLGAVSYNLDLLPQWEIGKYRVDFLIEPRAKVGPLQKKIIVELDGHAFHEKTKKQIEKDKRRERWLVGQGYSVLRFSGSEIYKDARGCVKETLKCFGLCDGQIKKKSGAKND